MSEQVKSQFPTEMIDLPSEGKLYPKEHPFSSGQVEMRYMDSKRRRYFNITISTKKRYSI